MWDYDRFGANEFLGEVTIDLGATIPTSLDSLEQQQMLQAQARPLWHQLRPVQSSYYSGWPTTVEGDVVLVRECTECL